MKREGLAMWQNYLDTSHQSPLTPSVLWAWEPGVTFCCLFGLLLLLQLLGGWHQPLASCKNYRHPPKAINCNFPTNTALGKDPEVNGFKKNTPEAWGCAEGIPLLISSFHNQSLARVACKEPDRLWRFPFSCLSPASLLWTSGQAAWTVGVRRGLDLRGHKDWNQMSSARRVYIESVLDKRVSRRLQGLLSQLSSPHTALFPRTSPQLPQTLSPHSLFPTGIAQSRCQVLRVPDPW